MCAVNQQLFLKCLFSSIMNVVSVMRITKVSEVTLISVTNRIRFWGKQLK